MPIFTTACTICLLATADIHHSTLCEHFSRLAEPRLQVINTAATFANPLLLHSLVAFVSNPNATPYTSVEAVLFALGMFAANSIKSP